MAWAPAPIALLLSGLVLAGCDQYARVGVHDPELEDTGAPSTPLTDATAPNMADAAPSESPDAAMSDDASMDGRDAAIECPQPDGGVQFCDPIKNDVCSAAAGQHCTVDLLQEYTGYCIFTSPTPPQLGGECFNGFGLTDSCAPTTLCYETRCRKVCLCDADCAAGQCCNEPLEGTGFSVCGDC